MTDSSAHLAASMSSNALTALATAGAQTRNVLGAYFPSWMFCALLALLATALVRWLLVRAGVDKSLPAPVVVYSALIVAFSLGGWLIWLS
jgi:hypothetical protein